MPVGFKNGTDGSLATAINAMRAAAQPHRFVGINQAGQVALLQTQGNPDGHVILRGGKALRMLRNVKKRWNRRDCARL